MVSGVQQRLLERPQLGDQVGQRLGVLLGERLAHARQHRPQRRDPGDVRRDVLAGLGVRDLDLRLVDLLLDPVVEQVRHAHQLHAPLERLELGDLLERRQVPLVRGADEDRVQLQARDVERHPPLLDGAQQVLVGLERPLEQVRVVDEAAVAVDQLALILVQRQRLQRRRQRRQRAVHRQLLRTRVDGQLRLDRGRRLAVAARDEEALDLDVAQHLGQVAVVRGEQRLEDLAVPVGQVAAQQVVGGAEAVAIGGAQPLIDQIATLRARQEQERVVAQLVRRSSRR